MAEETTGIKYTITVDDSQLKDAASKVVAEFDEISEGAAAAGRKMDTLFDGAARSAAGAVDDFASLGEQIQFQKDIIKDLEVQIKELEKSMDELAPGQEWAEVGFQIQNLKKELAGELRGLEELERQAASTEEKHTSLRTRLRELREELVAMEAAGKRGTDEYRSLQEEAGRLTDAIADANTQMRIMAHDQRGMQGIISGLTGLSGAFSAAQGVVGMFTKDQEKLQQVMLKVQSLMSITVGLQQVQQVLNKDSAFRLVIINGLKDYWLKVTQKATAAMVAEAAATKAAGAAANTSAGFFRKLAVAIKATTAGTITAILAALVAIAAIIAKIVKKQKDVNAETRREKALVDGVRDARLEAQKATMKDVTALETAVSRLSLLKRGSDEYNRTVKEVADTLGVQYEWLEKNTDQTEELARAWVKVKVAQATGDAYLNKAAQIQADTMEALRKMRTTHNKKDQEEILNSLGFLGPDFIEKYTKQLHKFYKESAYQKDQTGQVNDYWVKRTQDNWKLLQSYNAEIEELGRQQAQHYIDGYSQEIDKANKAMKPIVDAQKQSESDRKSSDSRQEERIREIEEAKKTIEEGNAALKKIMEDGQREIAQAGISEIEDGTRRRLAAIKDDYQQAMTAIDGIEEEIMRYNRDIAKANAAINGTEYAENMVKLTEEQEDMLKTLRKNAGDEYVRQTRQVYAEILQGTETYEQKRNSIIKEYADKRRALYASGMYDNLSEVDLQEREALDNLAQEQARKNRAYNAWVNTLNAYTLRELNTLLEGVKQELEAAEESGASAETVAVLQAKVMALVDQIEALKAEMEAAADVADNIAPRQREIAAWEALRGTVGEIAGLFSDIVGGMDTVSDEAKEFMGLISDGAGNMLDSIIEAKRVAAETGKSTAEAMQDVMQSADWITMAVKVVLAWAKMIASIFKSIKNDRIDETLGMYTDAIAALNDRLDTSVQRLRDAAAAASGYSPYLFTGMNEGMQVFSALVQRLGGESAALTAYLERDASRMTAAFRDAVRGLTLSYSQLQSYGMEYYAEAIRQADSYETQIALLTEQIREYRRLASEARSGNKEAEWLQKAEEAERELEEALLNRSRVLAEMVETIFANTAQGLASQIGDALVSAFESGEDAARAFQLTVSDIMKNVVKNFLIKQYLEQQIAAMYDDVQAMQEHGWSQEEIMDRMTSYFQQLGQSVEGMQQAWQQYQERFGWDETAATATSQGIASASQDSIDDLNGRMTVIQSHTAQLVNSSALCASNTTNILNTIRNIGDDTRNMRGRLSVIADDLHYVRNNI